VIAQAVFVIHEFPCDCRDSPFHLFPLIAELPAAREIGCVRADSILFADHCDRINELAVSWGGHRIAAPSIVAFV
jgi:hypothetical protein